MLLEILRRIQLRFGSIADLLDKPINPLGVFRLVQTRIEHPRNQPFALFLGELHTKHQTKVSLCYFLSRFFRCNRLWIRDREHSVRQVAHE